MASPSLYLSAHAADPLFWAKIDENGPLFDGSPCWLWIGARNTNGYGTLVRTIEGEQRSFVAHRYIYMLFGYTVPDGYELDHRCRVRNCCQILHLEPVLHKENVRRGQGFGGVLYTHCPQGHERTPDNLILKMGILRCRICYEENSRPLITCRHCGRVKPHSAHGLCGPCANYEYRHGYPRPLSVKHGPKLCTNCGCPAVPSRKGLCNCCYLYVRRTGQPRPQQLWKKE